MTAPSLLSCWPRRLDPDHALLVKPRTLLEYQKSLDQFVKWLIDNEHCPSSGQELDALVVQYKNDRKLSKFNLNYTIASLEFFMPILRGHLTWAKRVASGLIASSPTKHTVPLISAGAKLYGAHFSASGRPRLGIGIALQQRTGLRPSELLALLPEHVLKPEFGGGRYIFRLGADVGTKVKREQVAYFTPATDPELATVFCRLLDITPVGSSLFPYSYHEYLQGMHGITSSLGLNLHITPHSPRAGFASERVALGDSPDLVRSEGRWGSETSFKIYLDVVLAAQISAWASLTGLQSAIEFCTINFASYFTIEHLLAERRHGSKGIHQTPHDRSLRASRDGMARRTASPTALASSRTARNNTDTIGSALAGKVSIRTSSIPARKNGPRPASAEPRAAGGKGKGSGKGGTSGHAKLRFPK